MAKQLPEELRPLFEAVWQEVVSAHALWLIFCQLYVDKPRQLLIMRETAPGFFSSIRSVIRNSVVLSISRLSDASKTGKMENASLRTLRDIVARLDDSQLAQQLDTTLEQLTKASKPLRDRRNRALAHADLPTALLEHPDPLPGISKENIDDALHDISSFMNAIEMHYADSATEYENPIQHGDAKALLVWLEAGLKLEDNEREKHGLPRKYT